MTRAGRRIIRVLSETVGIGWLWGKDGSIAGNGEGKNEKGNFRRDCS